MHVIGKNAPAFTVASLAMIIDPPARDRADAGDDAGRGRPAPLGVHAPGGPQAELEEGRVGIDQRRDPLAGGEAALLVLALDGLRPAALADRLLLGREPGGHLPQVGLGGTSIGRRGSRCLSALGGMTSTSVTPSVPGDIHGSDDELTVGGPGRGAANVGSESRVVDRRGPGIADDLLQGDRRQGGEQDAGCDGEGGMTPQCPGRPDQEDPWIR